MSDFVLGSEMVLLVHVYRVAGGSACPWEIWHTQSGPPNVTPLISEVAGQPPAHLPWHGHYDDDDLPSSWYLRMARGISVLVSVRVRERHTKRPFKARMTVNPTNSLYCTVQCALSVDTKYFPTTV